MTDSVHIGYIAYMSTWRIAGCVGLMSLFAHNLYSVCALSIYTAVAFRYWESIFPVVHPRALLSIITLVLYSTLSRHVAYSGALPAQFQWHSVNMSQRYLSINSPTSSLNFPLIYPSVFHRSFMYHCVHPSIYSSIHLISYPSTYQPNPRSIYLTTNPFRAINTFPYLSLLSSL